LLSLAPVNGYSQVVVKVNITGEGEQVPAVILVVATVVGIIVTGAVGVAPSEVGTAFKPRVAPVVGTLAQVNLAVVVPLSVIIHAGEAVEPGTVAVIGVVGSS
jgi:hypothetical protein